MPGISDLTANVVVAESQQAGALPDRRQRFSHGHVQFGQRALQRIDHLQMQPQHRAVMLGDAPSKRFAQLGCPLSRSALCQARQCRRVGLASHDGIEHGPSAFARHVRQHAAKLEVGVLEHLLDAQRVLRDFPHQLFAGAGEIAQLLYGLRRHEAGADQAVSQQVGNPHRIVDVGLAAGNVADVRGVGHATGVTAAGSRSNCAGLGLIHDANPMRASCPHASAHGSSHMREVQRLSRSQDVSRMLEASRNHSAVLTRRFNFVRARRCASFSVRRSIARCDGA
jgi:hypothetical protein